MDVRVGLWRKLSTEELMLLNCGVGEDSWESLGTARRSNQSILKEISPVYSLEGLMQLLLLLSYFSCVPPCITLWTAAHQAPLSMGFSRQEYWNRLPFPSPGRIDPEAETPILWSPCANNWLIWKDPDAGKDWRREEKGTIEDEMVGWHHRLDAHEFGQAHYLGSQIRKAYLIFWNKHNFCNYRTFKKSFPRLNKFSPTS